MLTMGHGETGRLGHGDEKDLLQPKVQLAVKVLLVMIWYGIVSLL